MTLLSWSVGGVLLCTPHYGEWQLEAPAEIHSRITLGETILWKDPDTCGQIKRGRVGYADLQKESLFVHSLGSQSEPSSGWI